MTTPVIYAGTSGLQTPVPKRDFPAAFQDKSRLTYYASLFNSIEINSSFYKIPIAKTLARWAAEVPDDFKFTFKLWQGITHNKLLAFNTDDVHLFIERINAIGHKKGCLLVQFPPGLSVAALRQLGLLLTEIQIADANNDWRIAVEFRHRSWYDEGVYELLEAHNAIFVIHDMPASIAPINPLPANFAYLRLHGPDGRYKGSYEDDVLAEYAQYIKEWQDEGKVVYTYFNNTAGNALGNLQYLKQLL
jgi:uncharacterized protein YecE (DUF72 family)